MVLGISIGEFSGLTIGVYVITTVILISFLVIFYFFARTNFKQNSLFGVVAFLCAISIGCLVYKVHDHTLDSSHYTHFNLENTSPHTFTLQINERLKPSAYYEKYTVRVLAVDQRKSSGMLLLNIEKDSISKHYYTDDIMTGVFNFKTLSDPFNPYQFSYKAYLNKQQIFGQLVINEDQLLTLQSHPTSLQGYSDRLRRHINKKLCEHSFTKEQMAFINALLLGQRQDIEAETYQNYSNAGVVHILAISGLHVGILLMILQFVLSPLERFKHGKLVKILGCVLVLWIFAFIAGLSASVIRAVSMFTVLAIAINLKRPQNSYNTLAISMFFILLCKPRFLFDVGFQLSYLAVLGIISVQPMLYSVFGRPKNRLIRKLWETLTVTLSAQLGILPLSLFYFHKFPLLFLISNLIIIPLLGFLLGLGLLVIGLAILNVLPDAIVWLFGVSIHWMNQFVAWIAHREMFVVNHISFGLLEVVTAYFSIVVIVSLLKKPNGKKMVFLLLSIAMIQMAFLYRKQSSKHDGFIVFHKSKYSLIGINENKKITFYHNLRSLNSERIVDDYKTGSYTQTVIEDSLKSVYEYNGKIILRIDSMGIYNVKSRKPDIILLSNSPKINLERLIDSLTPEQIVADGSNYKSYVARWKATCIKKKLPFHNTNEKGAYILK